tara:strand:- start:136 stop:711 length:576 start_codon:yes stop_codon:yes gene_type:complete
MPNTVSCRYFKTSPEIIQLAVMLYLRFPLSLRNVEDPLHERSVNVSYEAIREITGERIRDKFAASKAKGIFMGGNIPVGYTLGDRKLLIDPGYSKVITKIFEAYLRLGSASKVKTYLQDLDIRTPPREHRNGKTSGGKHFSTGHLYQILSNPIYIGQVRHHGKTYDGEHEAILPQKLWDQCPAPKLCTIFQ